LQSCVFRGQFHQHFKIKFFVRKLKCFSKLFSWYVLAKALWKTEFSEFFIFSSFGISSIPNFPKITKKWCQNWIFGISQKIRNIQNPCFWVENRGFQKLQKNDVKIEIFFAKNSFRLEFQLKFQLKFQLEFWLKYSSLSSVCRALVWLYNFLEKEYWAKKCS